ncbi:hypothetical protein FDB30_11400 [Clostridium botulinum]|uniref:hypothetical protein n=1 Tax=Clostridium botulinum TaxID=1491 RepID=UPI000773F09F|nr:hypothetical protein [Clostridium botulinum]MBN1048297.1 hypothetical protein [Clostridium botulinum]MBN1077292.1 hypothetical protein [Clostridium botulinum]NFE84755.1 hypothetical protein [Clostridium botulinum]NFG38491.1 hypothetical protein [Clostridium botulinum]NFN28268.1 hypothetical protein [Clostridium botulinum]
MVKATKIIENLNKLYNYGEIVEDCTLSYLIDLNFLKKVDDKYVITKKFIKFTKEVTREDFISSLVCYYPPLLETLLLKVYKEALNIGKSGDSKALVEFINSIPKFADTIIEIRNNDLNEDSEIRGFYSALFGGYPEYLKVLGLFREMQKFQDYDELEEEVLGKTPDKIYTKGRKISSNVNLPKIEESNKYTLVPFKYNYYSLNEDIKEILSSPWETFLVVLGMCISESKSVGFEAISIKPSDLNNPYVTQDLNVYIHNTEGREVRFGNINKFVYEVCLKNDFLLFPDKEPYVNKVIFTLMDRNIFKFKDNQYVLEDELNERIYLKEIILKNNSRILKSNVQEYVEELRKAL